MERLAGALADVVRTPLPSPLARECIVVQGPGMERWLSMRLSEALGVWANPWFPFPRTLIELALEEIVGSAEENAALYKPDPLTLLITRLLPELTRDSSFSEVSRYTQNDLRGDRLITLARRLASVFDQYIVYRPELVIGWERGQDQHFQATLWRAITRELGPHHLAHRIHAFERALQHEPFSPKTLPRRIHIFGISTLAPAFLRVLSALSQHIDVHMHLLTPSPEYFGDFDRRVARGTDLAALLSNLGKVGRELIDMIAELPFHEPRSDLFELPGEACVLHGLQSDLASLTSRGLKAEHERPLPLSARDASVSVHICHSPAREVEVLRDQLRARFEADATLTPSDVVVLTPDIERYASAIESVMSASDPNDPSYIPYRITDRRTTRGSEVCEAFFALLALVDSRLYVSDVLDFLQRMPVRTRFGIEEAELDRVRTWLHEAGARWAIDALHRTEFSQPAFDETTLRFALDRLLVGYAAPARSDALMLDALPFSDVEGKEALLLGRLAHFLETLFALCKSLRAPRSIATFADDLQHALSVMLESDRELSLDHHALRAVLAKLREEAALAKLDGDVPLSAMLAELEARIDPTRDARSFLSGGVTFCEHVPMRAIPFRVVCMVGLDDESFPRRVQKPSFDLIADHPRPGDRSIRDDDKQLFLEALLSARDALIITYVGRSVKDDGVRPPSVVVDQLLRVIDQHFVVVGHNASMSLFPDAKAARTITHEHALLRFDPRYFRSKNSTALFSYDEAACALARSYGKRERQERVFVPRVLAPPRDFDPSVSITDLVRFFRLPARYFSESRLRIMLPRDLDPLKDREPIVLDSLEKWHVGDQLIERGDAEVNDTLVRSMQQQAELPPGVLGKRALMRIAKTAGRILSTAPSTLPKSDLLIDLREGELHVSGRIDHLYGHDRIKRLFAKRRPKHLLALWIEHPCLCAATRDPRTRSVLVSRDKHKAERAEFAFVRDADQALQDLLAIYLAGLCEPLPLFSDASFTYVETLLAGGDEAKALASAEKAANAKNQNLDSEVLDPYVRMMFPASALSSVTLCEALSGDPSLNFRALARRVYEPMLSSLRVGEMS